MAHPWTLKVTDRKCRIPCGLGAINRLARKCRSGRMATGGSREAASRDCKAHGTALGSRFWECRPHPLGRRTTRQNDGLRHPGRSAERRLGCAPDPQAPSASGGTRHSVILLPTSSMRTTARDANRSFSNGGGRQGISKTPRRRRRTSRPDGRRRRWYWQNGSGS